MTIIQHKRGTSERWAELNPVLSEGEIGYDTTVKKAKIGDGVTAWADLPFMAGGEAGDVYTKTETDNLLAEKANVSDLSTKQDTLISGTNIKTINGNSILGEGDLVISGGGGETIDAYTKAETDDLLATKQDTLVSGTNIKTINGVTLLGEGNIDVSGGAGGASIDDATTSSTSVWSSEKVNTEISTVKGDVQNLQSEVVTAQGDIAALDADVSTLNSVVGDHTSSITAINDSVGMVQADIIDLKENKQEKISDSATISVSTGSVGGVIPASPYELAGNAVVNSETNELTGTNANSYLKLPEPFRPSENDSWEIQAAFICKSMAGEYTLNPIFNEYDTNKSVPQLYCYKEYLAADISFDGSTWGIEEWGRNVSEMSCSNSVMNLGRLSYDASTKTLTLALSKDDGVTWASLSQTVSGQIFSSAKSTYIIGADNRTTGHGQITPIYLNKTWIKINGEYWWHPFPIEQEATATTANVKISTKEGNAITQEDDGLFVSSAGGGGGTSDYNALTNKPVIESTEIKGTISLAAPLRIEKVSTDNLLNASYSDGASTFENVSGGLFSSTTSSTSKYISKSGNAIINSDGTLTNVSYIDIPYKFGDVAILNSAYYNSSPYINRRQILFGYKNEKGEFRPVLIGSSYLSSNINDVCTPLNDILSCYSNYYYKNNSSLKTYSGISDTKSSYSDSTTYPELNYLQSAIQIFYDGTLGLYKANWSYKTSYYRQWQFDGSITDFISKITTVRLVYPLSSSYTINGTNAFFVKSYNPSNNFLTDIEYPDLMALPNVEIPTVTEHNMLSTGDIPNSYNGLSDIPKINGVEVRDNISTDAFDLQRKLTPNSGISIKQDGDWHFFDASYDSSTKVITFDRYNMVNSSSTSYSNNAFAFSYALNSTDSSASKIGTYVDNTKIIPTCGVITPFYKNVAWKFGYTKAGGCNRLIFGNYIDGYFYPKYAMCSPDSNHTGSANWFIKVSSIVNNSTNVFSYTNVTKIYTSSSYALYPTSPTYIGISYSNNTYNVILPSRNIVDSAYSLYNFTINSSETNDLNACTHCWFIPNSPTMGLSSNTQLATGDFSVQAMTGQLSNTTMNNSLILPDSEGNNFTTSISVKTDGVTTKINDSGELEAVAPANMITSDNIVSDTTIVGLNDAIEMAQGDITTLSTAVESNTTSINQITAYPKIIYGSGKILDADGDTTEGVGNFTLTLYNNGKCRIDFVLKITTAGTDASNFNWGISTALLKAINPDIPNITVTYGGYAVYLNSNGTKDDSLNNYGGRATGSSDGSRWTFGRIYQATGEYGGWSSSKFPVETFVYGYVIGTFNINEV